MTNPLRSAPVRPTPRHPVLRRACRGLVAAVAVAGAFVATAVVATPSAGPADAADPLGAGGEYHALAPARILDTRTGTGGISGARALTPTTGTAFDVQVLGQGGVPEPARAGDVLAVAMNVTVTGPSQQGYLRIWGTGATEGDSSLVNFQSGQTVPNMVIARPGADGKVSIRLISEGAAGTAHVLVDVFGWFSTSNNAERGARLIPVGPGRIFDSRNPVFGDRPLGVTETVEVTFRGADSLSPAQTAIVPNDATVVGALVNVTGVNNLPGSTATFLSVVPTAPPAGIWPTTSNLNLRAGQIKANLALVPVGPDGKLRVFNERGSVDVVVDVVAYLVDDRPVETRQGRVVPLASPFRALDTRSAAAGDAPLFPGRAESWSFADFVADVRLNGEAIGAQSAVIGNLTATNLQRQFAWAPVDTFMTVYPGGSTLPEASNVNLVEGESVPNMALLRFGYVGADPQVTFYNYNGLVDYLVDVSAVVLAD